MINAGQGSGLARAQAANPVAGARWTNASPVVCASASPSTCRLEGTDAYAALRPLRLIGDTALVGVRVHQQTSNRRQPVAGGAGKIRLVKQGGVWVPVAWTPTIVY